MAKQRMRRVLRTITAPILSRRAQRPGLGAAEFRAREPDVAYPFPRHTSDRGEHQTGLARPARVATGAIGEQAQLTLLGAVLHLASSGAADLLAEHLGRIAPVGEHEARIGPCAGPKYFTLTASRFACGGFAPNAVPGTLTNNEGKRVVRPEHAKLLNYWADVHHALGLNVKDVPYGYPVPAP